MNCAKCGKPIRNLPDYILEFTTVVCNECAVTRPTEQDIEAAREHAMPKKKVPHHEHDEDLPVAA